jgi:hypothetical protein
MDGAASKSLPSSVSEVEELIKKLYKPGPAAQYGRINDQLLQLQLSPYGWKLADELMNSDDPNVRFYAALTFTVKLNNDGPSLDAETAEEVQLRLITWLVSIYPSVLFPLSSDVYTAMAIMGSSVISCWRTGGLSQLSFFGPC